MTKAVLYIPLKTILQNLIHCTFNYRKFVSLHYLVRKFYYKPKNYKFKIYILFISHSEVATNCDLSRNSVRIKQKQNS